MAMTATIASNPVSSAVVEQPITMSLTISNSGANVVRMVNVVPYALSTGGVKSVINTGVSFDLIPFGPNANVAVPAGGTLVLTFQVKFHAPSSGILSTTVQTYDIGATCYSDDLSVFAPTVDTITVDNFTIYPTAQQ